MRCMKGLIKVKHVIALRNGENGKRGRKYGIEKSDGVLSRVGSRGPIKGGVYSLRHIGGIHVAATNTILHS